MGIKYEEKEESREVLAYIDNDGDLVVRNGDSREDYDTGLYIDGKTAGGDGGSNGLVAWNPTARGVKRRFYAGDTVTLTFSECSE